MEVLFSQVLGTTILLILAVLIVLIIYKIIAKKHELENYIDEYRKVKDEKDTLRIQLDTINHIYKNYEIQILDHTLEIISELTNRLPKIARKYLISRSR